MKALAFKQPWAHAVLFLGKVIDNRSRKDGAMPAVCKHRGPLLIHASASETNAYYREAAAWILAQTGHELPIQFSTRSWVGTTDRRQRWRRGGIVGRCNVIGHVEPSGATVRSPHKDTLSIPYDGPELPSALDMRWHFPGSWGIVLADVAPLPFLAWKGGRGLFEVPFPGETP